MKQKVLIITCLIFSLSIHTQTYERGGFSNIGTGNSSVVNYTNIFGIKGHRYYTDSWTNGTLIIKDSIYSGQAKLQYDLVVGDIIIMNEKNKGEGFRIIDSTLTAFQIYNVKNNTSDSFIRVKQNAFLENPDRNYFYDPFQNKPEKLILIDYRKKLFEPSTIISSYTSTSQDQEYRKSTRYYILNKDQKYVRVSLTKKSILKALNADKGLKKYIKTNKIDVKNLDQLYNLLIHHHSLKRKKKA